MQNVFGHPLAPLAPHPLARECFAQLAGVLGQRVEAFVLAAQLVRELSERAAPVAVELTYEVTDLAQLGRHRAQLLVDQCLLAVEGGLGTVLLAFEHGAVGVEQSVEHGFARSPLFVGQPGQFDRNIGAGNGLRTAPGESREGDAREHAAENDSEEDLHVETIASG